MEKTVYRFEDFLSQVNEEYQNFVAQFHTLLMQNGYKLKIESKANGLFASYSHAKTKRSIVNFFFRKKGFYTRVYVDTVYKHAEFLENLPAKMVEEIAKASVCKRLLNPDDCNPKCKMGYDFYIAENHYQKCRYSCFQFQVNAESISELSTFLENEVEERRFASIE